MLNQVTLVGRLTKDPVLRQTIEGKSVLNITLALTRHYKSRSGELGADFVLCTLWHKVAENTTKFCKKGSVIGIVGRIQTRNYENQEGIKVYITEVIAESVRFLGKKPTENRDLPRFATE